MFGLIPLPYKILAGAALLVGVFFFGYMKGNAYGKAELERYAAKKEKQVAELEKKNAEVSGKVLVQYVDKVNTIKEKEYVYLDRAKNNVPSQHDMSNGWVYTHDASATGSDADSTRASDASSSGVKDNQALAVVVSNYSRCLQNNQQLINLQQWVNENKRIIDEANAKKGK